MLPLLVGAGAASALSCGAQRLTPREWRDAAAVHAVRGTLSQAPVTADVPR
jgi:hypothetical protein